MRPASVSHCARHVCWQPATVSLSNESALILFLTYQVSSADSSRDTEFHFNRYPLRTGLLAEIAPKRLFWVRSRLDDRPHAPKPAISAQRLGSTEIAFIKTHLAQVLAEPMATGRASRRRWIRRTQFGDQPAINRIRRYASSARRLRPSGTQRTRLNKLAPILISFSFRLVSTSP